MNTETKDYLKRLFQNHLGFVPGDKHQWDIIREEDLRNILQELSYAVNLTPGEL